MTDGREPTGTGPDEQDPEVEAERTQELTALLSLIGRASGLSRLPQFDPKAEPAPLVEVPDATRMLNSAKHVPSHARLELLGRLTRSQQPHTEDGDLLPLAESLVRDDVQGIARSSAAQTILDRVKQAKEGEDPLLRHPEDLPDLGADPVPPPDLGSDSPSPATLTHAEVQGAIVTYWPGCKTVDRRIGGVQALNINTEIYTRTPLAAFEPIVNPLLWHSCWLENRFFAEMSTIPPGSELTPIVEPDTGWRATLLEVVDFGFGIWPGQTARTELAFVYFDNPPVAGTSHGVNGSTYDYHFSQDGKISVDQGYLLVEDLGPEVNARRYRTQKLVHMTAGDPPSSEVCEFWSLAVGMIQHGCAVKR